MKGPLLLVGVVVLLAACSKSPVSLDPAVGAILRGTVTRPDGVPVPDVELSVLLYDHPQCSGRLIPFPQPLPLAPPQDDGSYRSDLVFSALGPFEGCLTVIADPPDSVGLRPDTVPGIVLDFKRTLPYDTATVDFILEPR